MAQYARHHAALARFDHFWSLVRQPYRYTLKILSGRSGLDVTVGGHAMRLDPEFATQNWESVEREAYAAFAAILQSNGVVYDVGAHIGTYTIIAAKRVAPDGRVVAFEPHAVAVQYLRRHLQWNDVDERVVVREVCCGAREGFAEFHALPDVADGRNSLLAIEGFPTESKLVTTVDAEVRRLQLTPDVLKIDVEGAEFDVLLGAAATLKRACPTILLSLHPRALLSIGKSSDAVLQWLYDLGYVSSIVSRDHEIHVIARFDGTVRH